MQDITSFCYLSDIKPVLKKVYINDGYAIATDSYKLAKAKLPEEVSNLFKQHNVKYFEAKKYKELCKVYNKKNKNFDAIVTIIKENQIINADFDESYPDINILLNFDYEPCESLNVSKDNFKAFLDLMDGNAFDTTKLTKSKNKCIRYDGENITLLLMEIYK